MTEVIEDLWQCTRPAFEQTRTWLHGQSMLFSAIACLGRRTISGLICAQGRQYSDWGVVYRLFEKSRFDCAKLFAPIRLSVCEQLPSEMPIVAVMDDTICRKWGTKTAGTSWRRDPTGPHFRPNFVWAQRFVQISLISPDNGFGSAGRAIPVDFVHAPSAKKPRKDATDEQKEQYKVDQQEKRVSKVGAERIKVLRQQLNQDPVSKDRKLIMSVDGGYTNKEVFRSIPDDTVVIGRIRKDARLFSIPDLSTGKGRNRIYGEQIATPEAIRQDESIPWVKVNVYAAGQVFEFDVKVISSVRWHSSGKCDLQLMIVRPVGYRLTKKSRLLYREPAYLICTDDQLSPDQLLQAYVWRWEVEVNFREEKTLLGLGQAQVRTEDAVKNTSAFTVACYGMLHAAAAKMHLTESGLPLPKWRKNKPPKRCTTNQLVSRIRAEMWGRALGANLSGFVNAVDVQRSLQNSTSKLGSAVLYATQ